MNKKIAIIGAGNMGQAIAQGLLRKKVVTESQLILTSSQTKNNKGAIQQAEIAIFAVKPYLMKTVLEEVKEIVTSDKLILSVAAGVTIDSIEKIVGDDKHIIRIMPNIAAKVGESMSGWIGNKNITIEEEVIVKEILGVIGKEIAFKKENHIDMITAISGSGPAYFFYLVEFLENSARAFGLSEEEGQLLARQTLIGAGKMMGSSIKTAKELRRAVTSKGGTTEAAFLKFEKGDLGKLFQKGVIAAYKRAKELRI